MYVLDGIFLQENLVLLAQNACQEQWHFSTDFFITAVENPSLVLYWHWWLLLGHERYANKLPSKAVKPILANSESLVDGCITIFTPARLKEALSLCQHCRLIERHCCVRSSVCKIKFLCL
jgi:hypothetical protein